MSSSLHDAKAAADLARLFYDFLPGSGHGSWSGHVTFQTVATQADVGEFWTGGSKEPALARLLEQTLKLKRHRFEHLVLAIVSEGIKYRRSKRTEVREAEIRAVNRVIKDLGFKFPDLWDPAFLASLERDLAPSAEPPTAAVRYEPTPLGVIQSELPALRAEFYRLNGAIDRQAAGIALEKLLNQLFHIFDLNPREAFRITGEQIDGTFILDHETYLLEAKWEAKPVNEAALLTFRGKVEGKSVFTRGLFLSINGFTAEALTAITRGKQPTFILADGADLSPVFEQAIRFDELLRSKVRNLAETGEMLTRIKKS
jgi:hypothetical protein